MQRERPCSNIKGVLNCQNRARERNPEGIRCNLWLTFILTRKCVLLNGSAPMNACFILFQLIGNLCCSSIDLSSQTKSQGQGLTYTFQKHFSALNPPQKWQCLALSSPLPRCCLPGLASLCLHHCLPKWLHIFCILITQLYGGKKWSNNP